MVTGFPLKLRKPRQVMLSTKKESQMDEVGSYASLSDIAVFILKYTATLDIRSLVKMNVVSAKVRI